MFECEGQMGGGPLRLSKPIGAIESGHFPLSILCCRPSTCDV